MYIFLEEVVFNSKQLLSLHNFGNHTFSLNFLYNKIQFQVFKLWSEGVIQHIKFYKNI